MDMIIQWFQSNWANILVVLLALHTFLKAVRDAIDKTPTTDDNWFEHTVTFIGKVIGYLGGKRA